MLSAKQEISANLLSYIMQPFTITSARDNLSAIKALSENQKARVIGGGTNLLDLMKMYVEKPDQLIDINHLPLTLIHTEPTGAMRIGALVRNSDLAYHEGVKKHYPVLSQALLSGASPQIRNMATVGGNLLQRTRCPYFFNTSFPCNKRRPGSGCPAINGFNRSHAILGTSDKCIATHPSDMAVALLALEAVVVIQNDKSERKIPIDSFYTLPGDNPEIETVLQHDELITAIELPAVSTNTKSHYLKVRDRASFEFALTSAAVVMEVTDGTIRSARIALGGVGTKPWRAIEAEQVLQGAADNPQTYRLAAGASLKNARPLKYNAFKIELAKRSIIRALETTGGIS